MALELTNKKIFFVFIPAILLGGLALFIQIVRYEPLIPKVETQQTTEQNTQFVIPILPADPIIGNKKSPVTVIAFEDFSCEGCKAEQDLFSQLQTTYPNKVKMIWKGLPVNDFPYPSVDALRYGFCTNEQQKFNEFSAYAFSNSNNLSSGTLSLVGEQIGLNAKDLAECLASTRPDQYIELNKNIARTLNIQSVPTFFMNNVQIKAPQSIEDWKVLLGL